MAGREESIRATRHLMDLQLTVLVWEIRAVPFKPEGPSNEKKSRAVGGAFLMMIEG